MWNITILATLVLVFFLNLEHQNITANEYTILATVWGLIISVTNGGSYVCIWIKLIWLTGVTDSHHYDHFMVL